MVLRIEVTADSILRDQVSWVGSFASYAVARYIATNEPPFSATAGSCGVRGLAGASVSYWEMAAVAASWTLASSSSVMQEYWVVPASVMATNWSGSMAAMLSKPEARSAT